MARRSRIKRAGVPAEVSADVIARWGNDCWLHMPGCGRRADTSDHIVPDVFGGPTTVGNLRRACKHCNSRRHERILSGYGATYHAVIGPPCGGKSRYVDEHRQAGDIVIDFGLIATALTPGAETVTDPVRRMAAAAWYGAYRRAVTTMSPVTIWLVKVMPSTPRTPDLLGDWISLDYDVTVCDPGKSVVMERIRTERRLTMNAAMKAATQWYRAGITAPDVMARQRRRRHELSVLGLRNDDDDDDESASNPLDECSSPSLPRW